MKYLYTLLLSTLLLIAISDISAQTTPCTLTGGVVTVTYSAPPIMMHAAINGISQYTFGWNDGTPVGSSSQKPFYSGWCVIITDIMTGCDTTICESCIPTGGIGACPMIYMPVCGCDGNIYNNDCIAMQNGIFTFSSAIGPNGQLLPCTGISASWDCTPGQGCFDPGTGLGAYTTLSACQSNCSITPTWDCNPVTGCFDPGTGLGAYTTFMDCDTSCSIINPSWNCINGACVDPGTGQGSYTNYSTCVTACVTPTWDCDPVTGCFDPGTGQGAYATSGECDTACTIILPSWDCIPGQGCSDPGTGQGVYSSLSACDSVCSATDINEENLNFKIYPNPTKHTLTIIGTYTSVTIYNVFGKVVLTSDYQNSIDVATLSNGIYFIHIFTNNEISVKKITIAK